jgi:prepilin-type N-terminal cleavage/methylation domain-containing protein
MSPLTRLVDRARRSGDRGFTLAELLVASMLFLLLSSVVFTTVVAATRQAQTSRQYNDLNEEARLLLNRMSRELREAQAVVSVVNPGAALRPDGTAMFPGYYAAAPSADTQVTFEVDFNGNGTIEPSAADPERLTYRYDRANRRVVLMADGQTLPVLAAEVQSFAFRYTSRLHESDGSVDGAKDGIVQWEELDADNNFANGNKNHVLDGEELAKLDSITIEVTVLKNQRAQTYRTQVDLRNRPG